MGVRKKLRGGKAGTTDLNLPEGYSIPYNNVLSNESSGEGSGRGNHSGLEHSSAPGNTTQSPAFSEAARPLPADGK